MPVTTEPRSRTLYELSDGVLALESLLFESGGEITPEIKAWMQENVDNLGQKVDAYGALLMQWKIEAAGLKGEEERLAKKRKTVEASADRLKDWLAVCMKRIDKDKLKGKLFSVTRQLAAKRAMTLVADLSTIPAQYVKTTEPSKYIDKLEVAKALEALPASDGPIELTDGKGHVVARLEAPTAFVVFR